MLRPEALSGGAVLHRHRGGVGVGGTDEVAPRQGVTLEGNLEGFAIFAGLRRREGVVPAEHQVGNRDEEGLVNVELAEIVTAMVTKRISGNRFQIRTSRPQVEVCWEVKGVQNDRFVREYGAPVETEKSKYERGKYQHPELYGMPKEMGMNYRPDTSRAG